MSNNNMYGESNEYNSTKKIHSKLRGYDMRINKSTTDNKDIIYKFKENMRKHKLLVDLQKENISIITKIQLINDYEYLFNTTNKYVVNIHAGGLFNDWE
jgi:hypothetical protein